jgi:hypothetical protein
MDLRESLGACRQKQALKQASKQVSKQAHVAASEEINGPYSAGGSSAQGESAEDLAKVDKKLRDYLERQFQVAKL